MRDRLVAIVVALLPACGAEAAKERPARSPTYDYPPPAPRTAVDGEVLGADRVDPDDRLKAGGSVGSEGIKPGGRPRPGEETDSEAAPVAEDPCRSVGLQDAQGRSKCREPAAPRNEQEPAGE